MERDYEVTWKIVLSATSHEDAARQALEIHRDPESIATVFDVRDLDGGRFETVDLTPNL